MVPDEQKVRQNILNLGSKFPQKGQKFPLAVLVVLLGFRDSVISGVRVFINTYSDTDTQYL